MSLCFRNKLKKGVQSFILFFVGQLAHAQICPSQLSEAATENLTLKGWSFNEKFAGSPRLKSLAIIEGRIDPVENLGGGFLLRPQLIDNVNTWKFPVNIGGNEVWMRCIYAGGVIISRRLDGKVSRCEEILASRDTSSGLPVVSAGCFEK